MSPCSVTEQIATVSSILLHTGQIVGFVVKTSYLVDGGPSHLLGPTLAVASLLVALSNMVGLSNLLVTVLAFVALWHCGLRRTKQAHTAQCVGL